MMAEDEVPCISIRGVSKKFSRSLRRSLLYGASDIARELLGREPASHVLREKEFWALKDISFDVPRGRSVGIVGPNGSGKTTLLRIITGILKPSDGEVVIWGRIAPLLALGAGFKPVLSGRENVFINMALLGVPYETIQERFAEVVDFAELWDSIDAPVGTYSSGMLARLGFSCAIHTDPQILLVDEILAVGDARFRAKCRNRINQLRRGGTTFLIVSHNPISIQSLSDECVLLRQGRAIARGAPEEILRQYEAESLQADAEASAKQIAKNADQPSGSITIQSLSVQAEAEGLEGPEGLKGFLVSGKPGSLRLVLESTIAAEDVSVNVIIAARSPAGSENILFLRSSNDVGWFRVCPGLSEITLLLPTVTLGPGSYAMKVSISSGLMFDLHTIWEDIRFSVVDPGRMSQCKLFQPRSWVWKGLEVTRAPQSQPGDEVPEGTDE